MIVTCIVRNQANLLLQLSKADGILLTESALLVYCTAFPLL